MIQPIHHHVGERQIEEVAFQLQPGEISPVIEIRGQFLILKCEGRLPAVNADVNMVREKLADSVRDNKLHKVAAEIFNELHSHAVLRNVYNDPNLSRQMPGVAAMINDRQITMRELAEECIDRHGKDALEGTIHRHLLEQALRSHKLAIAQQDLDAEIARAAVAMGKLTPSKQPDIKAWIDMVTKEQGITYEMYIHDAVWPSVALKKLTGDVTVTKEDMQRGMEANYGPRVKCRVIVMSNQRKAQEVWEMARQELDKQHPDPLFFGRLAEQYSIDPSRAQQGQVPPIQKYGERAGTRGRGIQAPAGRTFGNHSHWREQRHPLLRRVYQAGEADDGGCPRFALRRHSREETENRHGRGIQPAQRIGPDRQRGCPANRTARNESRDWIGPAGCIRDRTGLPADRAGRGTPRKLCRRRAKRRTIKTSGDRRAMLGVAVIAVAGLALCGAGALWRR